MLNDNKILEDVSNQIQKKQAVIFLYAPRSEYSK